MTLSVVPVGLEGFAAVNTTASAGISAAGSVNSSAMLTEAATAVGAIGAVYLAAYAPAQNFNLAGTLLVGGVHGAIGAATLASKASYIATDSV
jgi:hypothetical protein